MPLNQQEKKALLLNLFRIACSRSEETATDAFSHILDANVFPELATVGADTPKSDDSASGAVATNHVITLDTDTGVRTFHQDPLNTAIDLVISEEDHAEDETLSHIVGSINHVETEAEEKGTDEEDAEGEEVEDEDAEGEEEDAEGEEEDDAEGEEEDDAEGEEEVEEEAEGEEEEVEEEDAEGEEGLEVETIKINKIYYWKDVNSDDVYTCVPPDDDVGDKVGTYKNGKFTRC